MLPATRSTPERQVLAAALTDPAAAAGARILLTEEAFTDIAERRIFRAIVSCLDDRVHPDMISVCDRDKEISASFLADLTSEAGHSKNVEFFSRLVLESHMRRRVQAIGNRASASGQNSELDPFDLVAGLQRDLAAVLVSEPVSTDAKTIVPALAELLSQYQKGETPDSIPVHFLPLDQRIVGLPRANVTYIAASSGMGKTSFIADACKRYVMAGEGPPALVVSAEMTGREFMFRVACNVANVDGDRARKGRATATEYAALRLAAEKLTASGRLHIDDTARPSLQRIHAVAMRIAVEHGGIGPIYVDYDQKLEPPDVRASKEEQIFSIASGLKDLAKEFNTAVVPLSQYTEDDRPKWPSDGALRYSKAKFHEAATMIHWYWPHYWRRKGFSADVISAAHPSTPYEDARQAWVVITKNRFGATGQFDVRFEAATGRIEHLPSTLLEDGPRIQTDAFSPNPDTDDLPF